MSRGTVTMAESRLKPDEVIEELKEPLRDLELAVARLREKLDRMQAAAERQHSEG